VVVEVDVKDTPGEDEVVEQVVPDAEALRPYLGKVVAYDEKGTIRAAGDTWAAAIQAAGDQLSEWTLMYVPDFSVVG
jgi:hypothetical protein